MIKSFNFGILFGVAATAGLFWYVPAVDQHREPSFVSVEANGGNRETFHVNLPQDRILAGMAGANEAVPPGLQWPGTSMLANLQTELFKLRDRNDVVVGVASRIAGAGTATGSVIEWTLHLPARGTLYSTMQPVADGSYRTGSLRAGTREFGGLHGSVLERHFGVSGETSAGSDVRERIELITSLVGAAEESE